VICYQVTATRLGVAVNIYGRDERDIAAAIWQRFDSHKGQQVRLELDPQTLKITGRGWILRSNKSVRTHLLLTPRRL